MKKCLCILITVFILILCSCETVNKSELIYYISQEPMTLDPQSVCDDGGKTVVVNSFMGLTRQDGNGEVVFAAAESCDEADNKVVFTLKDGLKWQNGTDITADDFVFAFQRLLTFETGSLEASRFFFLKDAEKYYKGEVSVFTSVKAENGKVAFYCNYKPADLYKLLSLPGAMPCNREFFYSTEGRYGLEAKCILSNGTMFVSSWTHNESIGMRKNQNYYESKSVPKSLSIFINSNNEDVVKEFTSGKSDALILNESYADLKKSKYSVSQYTSYYGGMIFNNDGVFSDANLRKAFVNSVDRENYSVSLTTGMTVDDSFVFSEKQEYNPEAAKKYLYENTERENNIKFIVPEGHYKDIVSYQTQIWQKDLGMFFGITELNDADYNSALQNGDFDIAFVIIPYISENGADELQYFCSFDNKNYGKYRNVSFDDAVERYVKGTATIDRAKGILSGDAVYIPILKGETYVFTQKKVKNAEYIKDIGCLYFGNTRE